MVNAFYKRQVVAIPDEVVADIEHLLGQVEPAGEFDDKTEDTKARVETFIRDIKEIVAEDDAKSAIIDNLTPDQEEKLKEEHMQDYTGTDDDAPDAYESWLEDITSTELKAILV
jgi:hypothetical protein